MTLSTANYKQTIHTCKSRIHAIGVLLTQVDGILSEVYEMALEIELEELHLWCDAWHHGEATKDLQGWIADNS